MLILHILTKKHPYQCLQNCAYIQKCYINRANMHDYCSFLFNFFNCCFSLLSRLILNLPLLSFSSIFLNPKKKKNFTNHQILQIYSKSRSQIHQTLSLTKKKKNPIKPKMQKWRRRKCWRWRKRCRRRSSSSGEIRLKFSQNHHSQ